MNIIAATPAALAELHRAKETAESELYRMRRINQTFRKGRGTFLLRGFAAADFERFADAIRRNPEYGRDPFPPRLFFMKMEQIERLEKQIAVGQTFLTPARAG